MLRHDVYAVAVADVASLEEMFICMIFAAFFWSEQQRWWWRRTHVDQGCIGIRLLWLVNECHADTCHCHHNVSADKILPSAVPPSWFGHAHRQAAGTQSH